VGLQPLLTGKREGVVRFSEAFEIKIRLLNVEIDREVELGRGPVDFKIASGSTFRLLVEAKKAHNGKFWHGLDTQLPSYLAADSCDDG
jgi:hypothetical protein